MFSKNEARPQYNDKVLKEAYDKEDHFYKVYDKFVPNPHMTTLTGKFWSKHDSDDLTKADLELVKLFQDYYDRSPAVRFSEPILESHEVGWYAKNPFIPIKRYDKRFYHPKIRSVTAFITPVEKKKT